MINVNSKAKFWAILILVLVLVSPARSQNKAIQFGGAFYTNIPNTTTALNFTADTFTLEAWIRPYSFAATTNNFEHTIIGNDNTAAASGGYVLRTGGSRKLNFYFSYGTGWQDVVTTTPVLVANQWQHVAVSKEAGTVKLYVDGMLVGSSTLATNTNITASNKTLKIGENGSLSNRKFNGAIDEIKIWKSARAQSQIQNDGIELCGAFPTDLLAYYKLDDVGTASANTITCATNSTLNGSTNGAIVSVPGALLFPGGSTILYVDSSHVATGCGVQAGYSWATAFSDLSTALEAAQMNPQIEKVFAAAGTYYPMKLPFSMQTNRSSTQMTSSDNKDRTFHVRAGLEVYGGYSAGGGTLDPGKYRTILDGSKAGGVAGSTAYNVVYMDNPSTWGNVNDTSKLIGFTVTNGNAQSASGINLGSGYGGGILCRWGTVLIQNCVVRDCQSTYGGGGLASYSTASIIGNAFINNVEGIYDEGTSNIRNNYVYGNAKCGIRCYRGLMHRIDSNEIAASQNDGINQAETKSTITGNYIHHNGNSGIRNNQVDTCYIQGNLITDHYPFNDNGGGMMLYGGKQTVINNIVLRDTGMLGGGIYCFNGSNILSGNYLSQNVGLSYGGGIWCKSGTNLIKGNIVKDNSAANSAGLYVEGNGTVFNNIIVNNSASGFGGGVLVSGIYSLANNLIAGNKANTSAGANCNSAVGNVNKIVNNTFFNNQNLNTTVGGAALSLGGDNQVLNNIFWRNKIGTADTIKGADYSRGSGNETFRYNAMQLPATSYTTGTGGNYDLGAAASNNLFGVNPRFVDSANMAGSDGLFATLDDGLQLANGSPLIDTGNSALLLSQMTADVKNAPRVYNTQVDLGAYELGCAPANITSPNQLNICKGVSATLKVNTAVPSTDVKWYADSSATAVLGTGYSFTTPALFSTDTFWISATGCSGSARIPIRVYVMTASFVQNGLSLQADTGATTYQWLTCNPFVPIPGANGPTYAITQNGSYTVAISKNGCTDTAACITISGLGIQKPGASLPVVLSPNPTNGIVTVSCSANLVNGVLYVTNTMGQLVFKAPFLPGKAVPVDMSNNPAGVYYFVISDGNKQFSAAVIKQ